MQKLLEIKTKDFLSGISVPRHSESGGIFSSQHGVGTYIKSASGESDTGLLFPITQAQSKITSDYMFGAVADPVAYKAYFIGSAGHFYSQDTSSDGAPSDLRSGTPITDAADGMAIFKPTGGTKYLYYFQKTQIGTWDLTGTYATGWTDNAYTGLQSTTIHPAHEFNGSWYYGNKDRIGKIADDGAAGVAHSTNVLDFPTEYTTTTISDDGYYLVAGITKNTISGNTIVNTPTKIIFWDTSSPSWNKEWLLNVGHIAAIRRKGSILYALTSNGLFEFTYSDAPRLIVPLDSYTGPSTSGGESPSHYTACIWNDFFAWINGNNEVSMYGRPTPNSPNAYFRPAIGFSTGVSTLLFWGYVTKLYTSNTSGTKFGYINLSTVGETTATAATVFFHFPRQMRIDRIDLLFGYKLASGDSLTVTAYQDPNTSTPWGTASYATHGDVQFVKLVNSLVCSQLRLSMAFDGGSPKLRGIVVWGTPHIQ